MQKTEVTSTKWFQAKNMEITKLCWNPAYKDLFAASYGSYNFYDQDAVTNGVVCVFSLKNPSYPEYLCTAQAGLFCWQGFAYFIVLGLNLKDHSKDFFSKIEIANSEPTE